MALKEFVIKRIRLFFLLTTLILVAQSVIGSIAEPGVSLHIRYIDLLSPIHIAALCLIPTMVTYSRKKLTVKQMLVRHAIQLVLMEGVILALMFITKTVDKEHPWIVAMIAASVFVIYAVCILALYMGQRRESRIMTEQLRRLQQSEEQ